MERIAIIDLGSNSARIVIAEVTEGGYFSVIDELKEPVRLAKGMEIDGFLKPLRIAQTLRTLNTFKKLYESHNVDKVFAYGTAAVRTANNRNAFVEEVESVCGIKLQVLSQEEEATFVYTGVINSMEIPKGLIIDIGGGSTKIIYYNRRVLIAQETLPFGAVTITERFGGIDNNEARALAIEEYVGKYLDENVPWIKELDPETKLVGVGGSIRNLGRISRKLRNYPLNMAHNYHVSFMEFDTIYDTIKPLTLEKMATIKGLSSARADIFPAAMSIVEAIKKQTSFEEIIIGGAGLREGALFRYAVPTVTEKPISDITGHGIYTFLNKFDMNITHCEHVYDLSMQLYKQLKVLHKLPRPYVKILRVASMLHDIGTQYKFYDHHKHSMYLIMNSNLYGIPQKDLVMASLIAGCHEKESLEELGMERYIAMLSEEEIEAVKKLGIIVRIAECFDRSRGGLIVEIVCDVLGDSVIMKTKSIGDITLEIKNAMYAYPEFKRAFKKTLEIL